MGWLTNVETQARHFLTGRTLIGRGSQCWIRIIHPSVSKEHAVLAFEAGGWTVKDLGSRNGTWANGSRLEPGFSIRVEKNCRLRFGDVDTRLDEIAAPMLSARSTTTERYVVADSGILSLPDDETPLASVYEASPGCWAMDLGGDTRRVEDGDTVYLNGERFVLRVPEPDSRRLLESTIASSNEWMLSELRLRLEVSRDQESIVTRLEGPRSIEVPSRATHQLLLGLGRQRVTDQQSGLVEAECGWVYSDELARLMGSDPQKVNIDVHRLRQQFARLGISDASRIIERRATSHQVRLGVARIAIA